MAVVKKDSHMFARVIAALLAKPSTPEHKPSKGEPWCDYIVGEQTALCCIQEVTFDVSNGPLYRPFVKFTLLIGEGIDINRTVFTYIFNARECKILGLPLDQEGLKGVTHRLCRVKIEHMQGNQIVYPHVTILNMAS